MAADTQLTKQFINNCLSILEEIHKSISQKRGNFQSTEDFASGYMRKEGILVDRKVGMRMFVLENYELFVLRGFIILLNKVFENTTDLFVQFSFRTLQEIGIKKIDVLFGSGISEENRKKFKLENTLSDWLELKENYEDFLIIFPQEKNLLGQPIIGLFEKAEKCLRLTGVVELSLLKKIRHQLQRNAGGYIKGLEQFTFLRRSNLGYLEMAWSHLLHGNPFHIEAAMHLEENRFRNRSHAILFLLLVNTIHRTKNHIDDKILKGKVNSLLNQADSVWQNLVNEWKGEKPR